MLNVFMTARLLDSTTRRGGSARATRVWFRYDPADPFAVQLRMAVVGEPRVTWVMSRDLLTEGLAGHAGDGDVRITSALDGVVEIALSSPDGRARLEFDRADLERAIGESHALVPVGGESAAIDWDHEIALLGRDAA